MKYYNAILTASLRALRFQHICDLLIQDLVRSVLVRAYTLHLTSNDGANTNFFYILACIALL